MVRKAKIVSDDPKNVQRRLNAAIDAAEKKFVKISEEGGQVTAYVETAEGCYVWQSQLGTEMLTLDALTKKHSGKVSIRGTRRPEVVGSMKFIEDTTDSGYDEREGRDGESEEEEEEEDDDGGGSGADGDGDDDDDQCGSPSHLSQAITKNHSSRSAIQSDSNSVEYFDFHTMFDTDGANMAEQSIDPSILNTLPQSANLGHGTAVAHHAPLAAPFQNSSSVGLCQSSSNMMKSGDSALEQEEKFLQLQLQDLQRRRAQHQSTGAVIPMNMQSYPAMMPRFSPYQTARDIAGPSHNHTGNGKKGKRKAAGNSASPKRKKTRDH